MELKDLKVRDVLMMDEFKRQIAEVMDAEFDNQRRAMYDAKAQGARLARTPLDRLRERDAWHMEMMVDYFGNVLNKTLIGFSSQERDYIYLIGMAAFKRTMRKLQEQEKQHRNED